MKKLLLMKTFLVAVSMLVGTSAWAQDSYPYNVGTSTSDGWFSQISPVYSLSTNGIIDITFTNHRNDTGDTWLNWLLVCGKSTDTQVKGEDNSNRYFILRADRWDDINGTEEFRDAHIFVSSNYWADSFAEFCNGATVNLKITRVGTLVTVKATMTKSSVTREMHYFFDGVGETENLQFYLTQNTSWLTIESEPTITEIITAQDYTAGVADWTSGNTGRYTVDMTTDGSNKFLAVNAVGDGNNGALITGTTVNGKVAAGATDFASSPDFTLSFDLKLTGGNDQPSKFIINDASNPGVNVNEEISATNRMLFLDQTAGNSTEWKINGSSDQTVTLAKNTWYSFHLSKHGSLLYLTVKNTSTDVDVFSQQSITNNSAKGGLGNMYFATKRKYAGMGIDNVVLRDWQTGDTPAGVAATYTIKYRMEGDATTPIKEDVEGNGLVGDEVTASAAQMADIVYNEQKYIYKSGNDNITLVADAASNVITLVYREAATYTYKLTSDCNNTVFANSSDFEGNTVYVPYTKYELKDGYLYESGKSTDWYRKSYTLTANVDETIAYTKTSIGDVVFYVEGENISGASINNNERSADTRNSNAAVGYAAGTAGDDDLTITTLTAGTYKIVANLHTSTSGGGSSTFILGANTFVAQGAASSYNVEKTSDWYTITENTDLKLQAGGGKTNAVDYVYIIKLPANVSKTITSAGWATYCSPYALDLNNATGLTEAYIVTGGAGGADGVLTTTSVKSGTVPENTGLLIKGPEGTATIPVVATSETDVSANKLKGVTVKTSGVAAGIYVLLNGTDGVGFYKTTVAFTVGANTAYLPANFAATTARGFYSFDEATGIGATLKNKETENKEVYNLKGQRVAQPTKGLYIVNGKKVVVK